MKRCWRCTGKSKNAVSMHKKHTLCPKEPLTVNNNPTFSRRFLHTCETNSNINVFRVISMSTHSSNWTSPYRYLTGAQGDGLETLGRLEAETDELLRKIRLLLQNGVSSSSSCPEEKDTITSQKTFRLVEQWSMLASPTSAQGKNAALRCHQVVQALEDHCRDTTLEPNRHYYDLVLQALCATGQQQAAHDILLKMSHDIAQRKENENKRRPAKLSAKSFHIVMNGWNSGNTTKHNPGSRHQKEVLKKVQDLYRTLESLYQLSGSRDDELRPSERTLTALLAAWAQSGRSNARNKIVELLQRASEQRESVDLVLFHTLMQSFTSGTALHISANRMAFRHTAELCEQLLQLAISQFYLSPTTQSYSLVINAWARCEAAEGAGEAAKRAEKLLRLMMQAYSTDGANVKPNSLVFTTCMAAWSRCDQPEKAERLLEELLQIYQQTKDPDLKPDTACGNTVVLAWSRSKAPMALEKTKEALVKLQTFAQADLISYNALLHAFSRRGMYGEALSMVDELEVNGMGHGNLRLLPDVVSYNCVLHALLRSNGSFQTGTNAGIAEEAQELVEKMKSLAKQMNRSTVNPTAATYTLLLQAYAKQGNSVETNRDKDPERVPLSNILQVLRDVMSTSSSSSASSSREKKTTRVDAMFCVALLQACSSQYQITNDPNEASKLAFEIMVGIMKATGQESKQLERFPSVSSTEFPSFRIHDDWLFVVMLETCERLLGRIVHDLGEPRSNTGLHSSSTNLGNFTRPETTDGTMTGGTFATTTMTPSSVRLVEWMSLIDAIVNRVQVEGYLSRRVVARLKALSKTLAKQDSKLSSERMLGQWLSQDGSEAKDDSSHPSSNDRFMAKELPREWSRRIPSKHRP